MNLSLNRKMLIALSMALSMVSSAQTSPPSTGTVHIYRYKLSVGQAAHPTVSCDVFPVARIQNGRVYTLRVSAGRHTFATADNPTGIEVDVEPGKEYFVRIDYPPSASFAVRASPILVAPEQGRKEISKIRPLDPWFVESATCGRP